MPTPATTFQLHIKMKERSHDLIENKRSGKIGPTVGSHLDDVWADGPRQAGPSCPPTAHANAPIQKREEEGAHSYAQRRSNTY